MLWVLWWLLTALLALVAGLFALYGPGVDTHNPRLKHPMRDVEKKFLQDHVAGGKEEIGFLQCPRPRNRKIKIFYRFWHPKHLEDDAQASNARGVVVVLHGLNSHSARNNTFMVELLQSGFVIAGIDHEGFGRSDGRHGYFESIHHLTDDAIELIKLTREKYKGRKVFLHGGSLGGLLVLLVLTRIQKGLVDGAVILCPAVQVHKKSRPPPAIEAIGKALRAIAPKLPLAQGNRGKNSSPEVAAIVDAMKRADPLFYNGRLRIGTGFAILDALEYIQDKLHHIDVPYLLQHGTADFVCHISGSEELHTKTSSVDKEFRQYANAAHDLSNEPARIRDAVVKDFVEWLEARAV
ncbi:hypothetical protein Poli38472_000015 [Pythium oligandrum]|uniref:Serine aminopeptidase S33 domain-containing protein n=1 Tax=Pythium oligandrum TaxID=41045 RepID=A0A8K1CBJ0_PYTOL|nr:hypothetical protein Poli38472_000015 [Pythium oligandrum]|eukprot:TMW59973.1 hypothetical protein Poli38472_000015 [Pythium oligandrum]